MMKNRLSVVLILIAMSSAVAYSQTPGSPLEARVDAIASQVLQGSGVPSASVAVVQHGRVVLAKAYGSANLEPRAAATTDMRYGIGSISTAFRPLLM